MAVLPMPMYLVEIQEARSSMVAAPSRGGVALRGGGEAALWGEGE